MIVATVVQTYVRGLNHGVGPSLSLCDVYLASKASRGKARGLCELKSRGMPSSSVCESFFSELSTLFWKIIR